VSGRDIGGAYKTDPEWRLVLAIRREALRLAGLCINGSTEPGKPGRRGGVVHGQVVPGTGKCQRCCDVARRTR